MCQLNVFMCLICDLFGQNEYYGRDDDVNVDMC